MAKKRSHSKPQKGKLPSGLAKYIAAKKAAKKGK